VQVYLHSLAKIRCDVYYFQYGTPNDTYTRFDAHFQEDIFMTMMKNLKKSMAQYGEMIAVIGHNA